MPTCPSPTWDPGARSSSPRLPSLTTQSGTSTAVRSTVPWNGKRPSMARRWLYRAPAATCNTCPLKPKCTESQHGRIVHRSFYADYLETVRGHHATAAYQKAMRKRRVWVEPLFAEAKAWHGLRRLRLRGLANANIQGLLIATGQNLKRLLSKCGWGRRPWPRGAPDLVLPPSPQALLAFQ